MEIIKNNKAIDLLRIFLGLVFLSAGIYRLFHWQLALLEFNRISLHFTYPLLYATIILEIIGGLLLLCNVKTKLTVSFFALFISLTLIESWLTHGKEILQGFGQLFFYTPTPTDFFLHFTYLIILISVFLYLQKDKK